jgi:phage shock protein C
MGERKRHGWGMGLYRNRRDGKICGVAAGLADYWDVADWVVRLMFIGAFLFTGSLAVWAYVAGWALLSPRPEDRSRRERRRDSDEYEREFVDESANEDAFGPELEYDERYQDYRPKRMFRYSESAGVRLARARERLDAAVRRVEAMETYVTSRRYNLNREFSRL